MQGSWFSWVMGLHIVAGGGALTSLALPFLSKKGGSLHRRSGWFFTSSMAFVGASAWLLALFRLTDGEAGNDDAAYFLAHVALFSSASVWTGIASVRSHRAGRTRGRALDFFWAGALLGSSVALGLYGLSQSEVLMIVFAALGVGTAVPQLRFWRRCDAEKSEWLVQHLSSMSNGAIAAITAFFVVNVERWGWSEYQLFFWIAPGLLGGAAVTRKALQVRRRGRASLGLPTEKQALIV